MKQIAEDTGICFFRVIAEDSLKKFLLSRDFSPLTVNPSENLIDEWLNYGSVYVDGLRVRQDLQLVTDQLIRLHTRRKSYVARDLKIADRIVFQNSDFLVLDKPAGLPTHPTLDNFLENAKVMLESELGHPIYVTHRLDVATSGLLLLAKTPAAQAQINKLFSKRRVEKFYCCFVDAPVALGLHTHFMDPESRIPKKLSVEEQDGWVDCRLNVLSCEKQDAGFAVGIELLTGRTHQIRAQLSHLGSPIIGDSAYGSSSSWPQGIALTCSRLVFRFSNQNFEIKI